jgi:hypothetical protein
LGAGGGAVTGAGLGAASRALRGWHAPAVVAGSGDLGVARTLDKRIADFGRRQVHAVTDYVPKGSDRLGYLRDIGIGGRVPEEGVAAAKKKLELLGSSPGVMPALKRGLARYDLMNAEKSLEATNSLMQHGATSLPGLASALRDPARRGHVLRAVGKDALFGGGMLGHAQLALGAHGMYQAARGSNQSGEGRGEQAGRAASSIAAGLIPSTLPLAGNVVIDSALGVPFRAAGRAVDRLRGRPAVARAPITDPTDPVASIAHMAGPQVHMSSSAAGKQYGGGLDQ